MSLHVIGMSNEDGQPVAIIECDKDGKSPANEFSLAITELQGAEARTMATEHANRTGGISNPRVGFPGAPYPIDAEGKVVVNPATQTIHRYRVDIPITQGMR